MYILCIYMYNTVYIGAYAAIKVYKGSIQGIYYDVGLTYVGHSVQSSNGSIHERGGTGCVVLGVPNTAPYL